MVKAFLKTAIFSANIRSVRRFVTFSAAGVLAVGMGMSASSAGAQSQDLPEGPGRAVTLDSCTGCHATSLLTVQRRSSEEWTEVVNRMISNGAPLTEDQYNTVIDYLGAYLGPTPAPATVDVARSAASDSATAHHSNH